MGVRIIDNGRIACLYDSVSDVAFGPVFYGLDESEAGEEVDAVEMADGFLGWLNRDARDYSPREIAAEYDAFRLEIEQGGWEAITGDAPGERAVAIREDGSLRMEPDEEPADWRERR